MVATVIRLSEAASTAHHFEAEGYYTQNDKEHRKASRRTAGASRRSDSTASLNPNASRRCSRAASPARRPASAACAT